MPDGRYGIFYSTVDKDKIVNSVIYEFTYTRNQGTKNGLQAENYFNNGIYRSGWTYGNIFLGSPFFSVSASGDGISNNKFVAHHIGIGGQFSNYFNVFPYRLLLSAFRNEGIFQNPYSSIQNAFYIYSEFGILRDFIHLDIQTGLEFNSETPSLFGVGLLLTKQF